MPRLTVTQIAVVATAALLFVLLLFVDTSLPSKKKEEAVKKQENTVFDADIVLKSALNSLSQEQKNEVSTLTSSAEKADGSLKAVLLDSLVKWWDGFQKPQMAAVYAEQLAVTTANSVSWSKAGDHYFSGARFVKEELRPGLYQKAMDCYNKTLALEPQNVDAKINLAACYVEGSSDPMKGITLLREVEKTDSNNVNLQLNFAFFSVKSQQFDKAIYRFNKVLKLNPEFIEAYLHLADVYQAKGDKEKAVECLEKYIGLEKDATIKTEVQNYINKLKT